MSTQPRLGQETLARHQLANLLHRYVAAADAKDVEAAIGLVGRAAITFPADTSTDPSGARALFERLWASPEAHRHDVSTLIVEPGHGAGEVWVGRAHYTRWVFAPEPVLHTLGEYRLVVDAQDWAPRELTVTRTWTRA